MDRVKSYMEMLEHVRERSVRMGIPAIDYEDGLILYSLASTLPRVSRCPTVFEAGSGIGYSTLWIAFALSEVSGCGRIIATEYSSDRFSVLREVIGEFNLDRFVETIQGDSVEVVGSMDPESIDMVFLDIEKSRYIEFFEAAEKRIRPGGVLAAHNIYAPDPIAGRGFVEHVASRYRDRWRISVAPTGAGMAIAVKL